MNDHQDVKMNEWLEWIEKTWEMMAMRRRLVHAIKHTNCFGWGWLDKWQCDHESIQGDEEIYLSNGETVVLNKSFCWWMPVRISVTAASDSESALNALFVIFFNSLPGLMWEPRGRLAAIYAAINSENEWLSWLLLRYETFMKNHRNIPTYDTWSKCYRHTHIARDGLTTQSISVSK